MMIIPCPHCGNPCEIILGEMNECDQCGTTFIVDGKDEYGSEDCVAEVYTLTEELNHLDDATLLEDCIEICKIQKYVGSLEDAIEEMENAGELSDKSRKKLEGIYILHFGSLGVEE